MEESDKLEGHPEQAQLLLGLAKKVDVMMSTLDSFGDELRHLRAVVIGNGDSRSMLNQIKHLEFGQNIAKTDRERMERQIEKLQGCVTRMEKEELDRIAWQKTLDKDQDEILLRLTTIENAQKEQGDLIAAFRNRIIGIVAVLSLLAGAGAGFVAAARLLEAAVP